MAAVGSVVALQAGITGYTGFINQLATISSSFANLGVTAGRVGTDLEGATGGFRAFNTAVAATQGVVNSVGRAFETVTTPIRLAGSALGNLFEIAETQGTQALKIFGEMGSALAALGTGGAAGLGGLAAAAAGGIGAAIGIAARFHRELTDLQAITRATPAEVSRLDTEVRSLALQFAATVPEIQRVSLELQKAGISTDAISAGFLKVALSLQQLSKGELSSEGAGQGLGSLFNLFRVQFEESGESAEEFARRLGNATSVAANTTRATIPEVLSGITKIGPSFAAQGRSIEETFAALTLILSSGLRGEEAGTGLRNMFNFLINPSNDAMKVINDLKLTEISPFDIDGNLRPALDVIQSIQDVFSKGGLEAKGLTPAQGVQALTEIFQTRGFTVASLAILQGSDALARFFDELERADVIAQAQEQMNTLLRQLDRIRNAAELAAIAFGRNFLDSLKEASKGIVDFFTDKNLEQKSGALGGGLTSIITGQGGSGAFEGIDKAFGADAAAQFGNIFNQVQSLKAELEPLVDSAGRLKDVFVSTFFPDGIPDDLGRVGEGLKVGVELAIRFTSFLNQNLPEAANNFGTLTQEALDFAGKLRDIINQGEGFDQIQAVATSLAPLFGTLRVGFGEVAKSIASFVRSIIDNRDQIVAVLTTLVRLSSLLAQAFFNVSSSVVNLVGNLGKLFASRRLAEEFEAIGRDMQGRGPVPISEQTRDITGRGGGGLGAFGPSEGEASAELVRQATEANNEYLRSIGLLPPLQEAAADSTDDAAAAAARAAAAYSQDKAAKEAAARATKALETAQDRLAESSEDAAKSARTAFRTLQNSLEGIEQRWNDAMESIAEQTEDSFRSITEGAEEQRQNIQQAFQIRTEQEGEQFTLRRRHEQETRIFQEAVEDRRLIRQQEREDADTVASQQSEDRVRIFTQGEERISRERQRSIDDFNRTFARSQEELSRGFQRGQEDAQRSLTRGFDVTNLGIDRGTEDTRRTRDFGRALSKATTEEERKSIQERFAEETVAIQERRTEENASNARRLAQETQLLSFRRSQEVDFQTFKRTQEDNEVQRKRAQEEEDIEFRMAGELRLIFFRRQEEIDSRNRARLLDARELLTKRDEVTEGMSESDRQLAETRNLARQQAVAGIDRELAQINQRELRSLISLFEQADRRRSSAARTANREQESALRQHGSALENINEKQADLGTDVFRSFARLSRDAEKEFTGPALEQVLNNLRTQEASARAVVSQAQAVVAAQGIIAGQTANATIEETRARLSQMTTTVLVQSPQVDRLTTAIEQLTTRINEIAPGTSIEEVNIQTSQPAEQVVAGLGNLVGSI